MMQSYLRAMFSLCVALVTITISTIQAAPDAIKTEAGLVSGAPVKDGVTAYWGSPTPRRR